MLDLLSVFFFFEFPLLLLFIRKKQEETYSCHFDTNQAKEKKHISNGHSSELCGKSLLTEPRNYAVPSELQLTEFFSTSSVHFMKLQSKNIVFCVLLQQKVITSQSQRVNELNKKKNPLL